MKIIRTKAAVSINKTVIRKTNNTKKQINLRLLMSPFTNQ